METNKKKWKKSHLSSSLKRSRGEPSSRAFFISRKVRGSEAISVCLGVRSINYCGDELI